MKRPYRCLYESSSSSSAKTWAWWKGEKSERPHRPRHHKTTNLRKKLQKHQKIQNKKREMYGMVARNHFWYCKRKWSSGTYQFEVLLTYPGVKALLPTVSHFYGSTASNSWLACTVSLALLDSNWGHPGAQIDSGVFIDHGSGLIGETAIVEKGVLLYHEWLRRGGTGRMLQRHPTVRQGAHISPCPSSDR